MKRILSILIVLVLAIGLIGCESNSKTPNEEKKQEVVAEDVPPVVLDDAPINITVNAPDSIGTVYMKATYTNNSKYPIKGYQATVLLKDSNEKTYLSCNDTVMPGETSPNFQSFGPSNGDLNSTEILAYEITANVDGEDVYIDYDCKLKQYEWR